MSIKPPASRNVTRIPNLPIGPIVDSNGQATDEELTFRQALLSLLQDFVGNEGLVMPKQNSADVTIIQNNTAQAQGATPNFVYTCQYGTLLYDVNDDSPNVHPLKDEVVVAVNNGSDVPIFKQVVLLDGTAGAAGAITRYGLVTLENGTQYKIALYALV